LIYHNKKMIAFIAGTLDRAAWKRAAWLRVRTSVDSKVDFRHSGFEKGASGRPFQR